MKASIISCCVFSLLLSFGSALGQKIPERRVDIQSKIDLYKIYFSSLTEEQRSANGSGFKPFKRWEWFVTPRAFADGTLLGGARWNAFQDILSKRQNGGQLAMTANWTSLGPSVGTGNSAGRMLDIAFDPNNSNVMWGGSASGGIWKTANGGASWTPMDDQLPTLAIGCVVTHNTDSNIIYIGTGEGSHNIDAVYGVGVLKSTDGGVTWNQTGLIWQLSNFEAVNEMAMHPGNPNILIAATNDGVYRTTDAGASWSQTLSLGGNEEAKEVLMDPDNANNVYVAMSYLGGAANSGIYKSTDNGITWTKLTNGLPANSQDIGRISLAMHQADPDILYAGIAGSFNFNNAALMGVYKTTDGGSTWTLTATSPNFYGGQGWYDNVIAVDPVNPNIVYSGGVSLYKSTDGGINWSLSSPGVHVDYHAIEFHPNDPNTVFVGNDGGIWTSSNAGGSWIDLNDGLTTMQFYAMGSDPNNAMIAFGGTQDNGTSRYTAPTWNFVLGGDGGECNVDYTNSNIIYAEHQLGNHRKSTDGGNSWTPINNGLVGQGPWVAPVEMDPLNPQVLYTFSNGDLYKTTTGGSNWFLLFDDANFMGNTIRVAPSDTLTIYVGGFGSTMFRTTDGGTIWTDISAGLLGNITSTAVHPSDPQTLYVSISGWSPGIHVFKSTDGGDNWQNVTNDLPNIPCNSIVLDQDFPDHVYVGTDLGVYLSTNGGVSWTEWNDGLANVVVDELDIHAASRIIRAATHGRGMYESPLQGQTLPAEDILLVDDDAGASYQSYFESALTANFLDYDLWDVSTQGEVPLSTLAAYQDPQKCVIWLTGDDFSSTLSANEQANLSSFLDGGGRLFISGQDIGYYLVQNGNGPAFFTNYLHANYIQDDISLFALDGTAGDPIGNGLSFAISGGTGANNQNFPSEIDPISPALTVFTYDSTATAAPPPNKPYREGGESSLAGIISSGTGGLRVDTGISRVAYFAFGFEAIANSADRDTVMSRTVAWLHSPSLLAQDSLALVALYNSTNGPNWTRNDNWLTGPVSTWYGITVSGGRVTNVALGSNQLNGSIPPELGNLSNLQTLRLFINQLSGAIPSELGNLSNVQTLNLSNNQLSGAIPSELGNLSSLQDLFLFSNQLSGAIPPELGNLSNLQDLSLGGNQLSGSIPPELGNLLNLQDIWLQNNQLSGAIPSELGNLSNLQDLLLSNNQLSGAIPPELGNLSNLQDLWLFINQLSGTIPPELGNLLNLSGLYLHFNQLSGSIPPELGNLSNLQNLYIYNNQFIDLPDLSTLPNLFSLRIETNKFTFEDIEPNIGIQIFTYAPQDSVGAEQDTTVSVASSLTLSISVGGQFNQYQWKKDSVLIPGATDSVYTINPVAASDAGDYTCDITNTVATALTLYSRPIHVNVTSLAHFNPVAPTGDPRPVVIQNATIDSLPIVSGDEIGVFDDTLCVGAGSFSGTYPLTITIWMEVSLPGGGVLPGATAGNPMSFKMWQMSSDTELPGTPTYTTGSGIFGEALTVVNPLSGVTDVTQTIPVKAGLINLISFNVLPPDLAVEPVFDDLDSLLVVQDDQGQFYIPPFGVNTIGNVNICKGYQVFISGPANDTLFIVGQPLDPETCSYGLTIKCHNIVE